MLWRSRGWCGFEFAAPVDRIDVDAEGVLAEHIGRSRWAHHSGENRGPEAGSGQRSALIRRLGPLHLERARRGSAYAREDWKRVVSGKRVSVRDDLGGVRSLTI